MSGRLVLSRASPRRRRLLRLYERLHRRYGPQRWRPARLPAVLARLAAGRPARFRRRLAQPVAALRAELRGVPGIGPETADAILLHVANRPVFPVDAATRRVLARHRIAASDTDYAALQGLFMDLPRDPALYGEYHALLVRVAKEHCRARPRCEGCPLRFDLRGRPPRG
jgi:endonuclease-3 related protein